MDFFFHGWKILVRWQECASTLPGFVARVRFVDDVDTAFAAHHLTVRVASFE
jgi:hypothetical protein